MKSKNPFKSPNITHNWKISQKTKKKNNNNDDISIERFVSISNLKLVC